MSLKIAVLMPGNLGCYKIAIDSIKENIIEPNNADIFIVGSKSNQLSVEALVDEKFIGNRFSLPIDDTDINLIKEKFGDRLKSLLFTEDINDYYNRLNIKANELQERIKWFEPKKPHVQFYDIKTKKFQNPIRYLDAFFKLYYAVKELEKYEIEHSIKYDFIVRMRIDQFLDKKIIIFKINEKEKFYWNKMDNFFYGTSKTMKYVCSNFVDKVGSYNNREINESGDYRLTLEPQFREFINSIKCQKEIINLVAGTKLYKENLCITLPNWKVEENNRKSQGKTFKEYYQAKDVGVVFYPIYSEKYPYIWVYYLH